MKNLKSLLLSILITIVFGGLYYYIVYPAINITNFVFDVMPDQLCEYLKKHPNIVHKKGDKNGKN